ncbi:MAG: flagellar basal body-associated FliL family protein [Sideroxydans sp.]|jgi:flagellar FliL protein
MSKPAKPAAPAAPAEGAEGAAPPKSKKMLFIIIGVVVLLIAGGAGWYFTKGHAPEDEHAAEVKVEPAHEPKYVSLGENFTVNLLHEDGDQYLQAGITLKILDPALEEKIKARMPEIKSKLLFLLANKLPSELQTAAGKQKLVSDIIAETDAVLELGDAHAAPGANAHAAADPHAAPVAAAPAADAHAVPATNSHAAPPTDPHAAPAADPHAAPPASAVAASGVVAPLLHKTTGIVDVLFTAFIIQ